MTKNPNLSQSHEKNLPRPENDKPGSRFGIRSERIGRPLALALVLAVGLAVIWAMFAGMFATFVSNVFFPSFVAPHRSLVVFADGTPVIAANPGNSDPAYSGLDGEPIEPENPKDTINGAQLGLGNGTQAGGMGRDWAGRIESFRMTGKPSLLWYFVNNGGEDGAGYFVGYEQVRNGCLGYLGTNGWTENVPSEDEWFPVPAGQYLFGSDSMISKASTPWLMRSIDMNYETDYPEEIVCIRSLGKIRKVNLVEKTVDVLFEDPQLIAMAQFQTAKADGTAPAKVGLLAVRLPARTLVLSRAGETLAAYVIPQSLRTRQFTFYATADERAMYAEIQFDSATGKETCTITWADQAGMLLDRKEVALNQLEPQHRTGSETLLFSGMIPVPGVALPMLAVLGVPEMGQEQHPETGYWKALCSTLRIAWPAITGLLVLGVVLGWATIRRQKKSGLPYRRTWAVFVFLFGVPGYLAYLCHRRWPVREECGQCHAAAPQDRGACAFCDAPFPDPAPKGIEVFA